jgi:hypothetical protein
MNGRQAENAIAATVAGLLTVIFTVVPGIGGKEFTTGRQKE